MCPTALSQVPRNQWVLQWPGQVVICVSSIFWTQEVSQALVEKTLPVSEPIMKLVGQIQTWIEFEWHIIRVDVFSKIIAKIVNLWCHRSQGSFGDSRTENLELGLSWSSVAQEVSRFFLDRNSRLQNSLLSAFASKCQPTEFLQQRPLVIFPGREATWPSLSLFFFHLPLEALHVHSNTNPPPAFPSVFPWDQECTRPAYLQTQTHIFPVNSYSQNLNLHLWAVWPWASCLTWVSVS